MHKLAIGIPTLNNVTGLHQLVIDIFGQSGIDADICFMCNGLEVWEECKRWEENWQLSSIYPGDNIGVGASWNRLARWAFDRGHERVAILNDDVRLESTSALVNLLYADRLWNGKCLFTAGVDGWHAFLLPRELYQAVGPFDPGFYPAYYEDNDYSYRLKLLKEKYPDLLYQEMAIALPIKHTLRGSQKPEGMKEWLEFTHPFVHNRYLAKWGGPAKQEVFTEPVEQPSTRPEIIRAQMELSNTV